jgi:hypothetical protein
MHAACNLTVGKGGTAHELDHLPNKPNCSSWSCLQFAFVRIKAERMREVLAL